MPVHRRRYKTDRLPDSGGRTWCRTFSLAGLPPFFGRLKTTACMSRPPNHSRPASYFASAVPAVNYKQLAGFKTADNSVFEHGNHKIFAVCYLAGRIRLFSASEKLSGQAGLVRGGTSVSSPRRI